MADDLLEGFGAEEKSAEEEKSYRCLTLLLFEYAGQLFGVDAHAVDAVVPWKRPTPLPTTSAVFAGVVQDRGRIVGVIRHPLLGEPPEGLVPKRVLVCRTSSGLVGIPASETRGVSEVKFAREVAAGEVAESSAGALTYIDPAQLLIHPDREAATGSVQ